jgi:hypothetical protein
MMGAADNDRAVQQQEKALVQKAQLQQQKAAAVRICLRTARCLVAR